MKSKKHRNICTAQNYIDHFVVLASAITGCVSLFAFASLVGIPVGITSYKSIIKEKEKKHDKKVLLAKSKLNSIEVLICKALRDLVISHDFFNKYSKRI